MTIKNGRNYASASPNPFKRLTAIAFSKDIKEIAIYDACGRLVRNLKTEKGIAQWNGCDDKGTELNQGIYFGIGDKKEMIKLILVK